MTPVYKGGLQIGGKFGDYTVERLLGTGGMGSVYLICGDHPDETFAAKILNPLLEKTDPEYKQRFMFEADLAMKIHHENLIAVYDVGRDPDTNLGYILMEYVPGGTVRDRIEKWGALSLEEATDIVTRVAQALVAVDAHHVVHRDIKPDNIMFAADGVTPKLADLGIARLSNKQSKTTITQQGFMLGSPAYMAPEQMEDSHTVDIRADIHALGVSFWEMLAGHRPNPDEDSVAIVARAMKGVPIPDIRTVRPDVPAAIAQLIVHMTKPNADERIRSPRELLDELARARAGKPLLRPDDDSGKRSCLVPFFVFTGLLVALGLLAYTSVQLYWAVRPPPSPSPLQKVVEAELEPIPETNTLAVVESVSTVTSAVPSEVPAPVSAPVPSTDDVVRVATDAPSPLPPPQAASTPAERAAEAFVEEIAPELNRYASCRRLLANEARRAEGEAVILKAVNEARAIDPDLRAYDLDGTSMLAWMNDLGVSRRGVLRCGKLFYIFELLHEERPSLLKDYRREKIAFTEQLGNPRPLTLRETVDILGRAVGRDLVPLFQEYGIHAGLE